MTDDSLETTNPPDTPEPLSQDPSVVSPDNPSLRVRPDLYDEEYSDEQYAEMLKLYEGTLQSIVEGEIVQSKVLRVTDTHVILDVGFKSEGAVPIEQFKDPKEIEAGQEVEVFLERLEDDDGAVVLSKKKADFMRVWEKIRQAHENDEPVMGTLQKKIKGGVVVDLMGVDAFLPGSQIALRRVPNIDELLGQEFEFKIIKLNKRRRNIVVSRRVILEAERATKREHLITEIEVNQVRKGVVKNITDFGAFIDLGGVDGLLHITDMSYGRVSHPSEIVELGGELDVKILDIDWDRERISLGLKQLQEYPWENVAEKYPVGARVQGKVVSITNYGAFVELEPGIEGLVHISEMSWTRNVRHPSKIVSIGETIEAVVLKVDPSEEKISLGMKQTEQDPWLVLPLKFPLGTRITGKVRNLTSFGAFVEIEPGIDGLIHISDMSWTKRVQHPAEVVKKNDTVDVVILSIDSDNKRISLGLKQAQEDPWLKIGEDYPVGSEHDGHVARFQDGGVVVDMGNDLEGFVPESQLPIPEGKSPESVIKLGQEASLKVMEVDPIHHRIILAITELGEVPPQEETKPELEVEGETEAVEAEAAEAAESHGAEQEAEAAAAVADIETSTDVEASADVEASTEVEASASVEGAADAAVAEAQSEGAPTTDDEAEEEANKEPEGESVAEQKEERAPEEEAPAAEVKDETTPAADAESPEKKPEASSD